MTPYLIENTRSVALLGIFRAPSGRKAIRAMLRDAGYAGPVDPDLRATPVVVVPAEDGWHWVTETGLDDALIDAGWAYLGEDCWQAPEPDAPLPELPILRTVEVDLSYEDPGLVKVSPQDWVMVR